MRLKICGLKNERDIEIINEFMPDYAGFVFAESKRRVDLPLAKRIIKMLDDDIKPVGVFVNEELSELLKIADACDLYAVQLHGDEDESYINELAKSSGVKIIKCIRTREEDAVLSSLKTKADYILFDAYSGGLRGGTGKSADLEMIAKIRGKIEKPFFLAGGINPANVSGALALKPYAIDVSSGAEGRAGGKDRDKVMALCKAVCGNTE